MNRPFHLERIDHIVIRCHDFPVMFDFYTLILGCTIDEPAEEHVNRFGGALTHLRAGSCYIDLLAYDTSHLTEEGKQFAERSYAGGAGIGEGRSLDDLRFSSDSSTLDHLCIRVEPFDEQSIKEFLSQNSVTIVASGNERLGADGVGPSIYVRDPEGNVIELKGKPNSINNDNNNKNNVARTKPSSNSSVDMNNNVFESSDMDNTDKSDGGETPSAAENASTNNEQEVPITPCNRICRYNNSFYNGQVCIGCFRDTYEIKMWQSMTPSEKSVTLLDAIDRCSSDTGEKNSNRNFDGAVTVEELVKQYNYWAELAKEAKV